MNLSELILPGSTIGIIGGGQLGRMMSFAAKSMGFQVGVLDPTPDCPTAQVADWQLVAPYDDVIALKTMAEKCDVLTYEFENVDVEALAQIEHMIPVPQGSDLLAITQDRLLEKAFLEANNINISPYATIVSIADVQEAIEEIGFPCVLKTTRGGYDGKGQHVMQTMSDIKGCLPLIHRGTCVLEAWVPFEKELSVMVAANWEADITVFPVVENIHRHNILHETLAPAEVDLEIQKEVKRVATLIASSLNLRGILGIEMFLTAAGGIYVNELAPRPHNSAHYSIEACDLSQFAAHIRGICNWPLPKEVQLLSPAIMVNILGQHMPESIELIKEKPDWHFHFYGKPEARRDRKMGHITILTKDIKQTKADIFQTGIWE